MSREMSEMIQLIRLMASLTLIASPLSFASGKSGVNRTSPLDYILHHSGLRVNARSPFIFHILPSSVRPKRRDRISAPVFFPNYPPPVPRHRGYTSAQSRTPPCPHIPQILVIKLLFQSLYNPFNYSLSIHNRIFSP